MRNSAPALLPVFRSQAQAELLMWLYLHPDQSFGLTELAKRVGTSVPTIHREAERLVDCRLIDETIQGRNRLLSANMAHPAAEPLARVLEITIGPRQVIADEFADIPGADRILIYGSWAARYSGKPGHFPNDIDVMIIGDGIDRGNAYAACDRAQQRLGIPVSVVLRTPQQWDDPADRLAAQLHTQPLIDVSSGKEKCPETPVYRRP